MAINTVETAIELMLFLLVTLPIPLLIWSKAILENRKLSARIRAVETTIRVAQGRSRGGRK